MKRKIGLAALFAAFMAPLTVVAFVAVWVMAWVTPWPCEAGPPTPGIHSVTPGWSYAIHCEGKGPLEVFKGTYAGWLIWKVTPL